MRPIELAFTGLRSYTEFGPVSFDDKSLVGILGDTGAGKSTILEALCVALYGKCSWSERDVKELIADGARTMSVDLTFTHDGHTWRVRRVFYANTIPSTHLLENLDTGARFDNARPVDAQIVGMLRLDFTAFKSCVLLPQGRFQTLLHASGRDRAELLKGIFGADVIEIVRDLVATRRTALTDLIHSAELARTRLRPDPVQAAADAHAGAEAAEARHHALADAVAGLRAAQAAAAASNAAAAALHQLRGRAEDAIVRLQEVAPTLDAGVRAAAEIAAERRQLDDREERAQRRHADAEHALTAAQDAGEGVEDLGRAAGLLAGVDERLTDLAGLDGDARAEHGRLDEEAARLATAEAGDPTMAEAADQLTIAASGLAERLDSARAATGSVRDRLKDALTAASTSGTAARRSANLDQQAAAAQEQAQTLRQNAAKTAADHAETLTALQAARRAEAAATAGAHLHPGDACPVCTTPLPDGYTPPTPADPAALTAAETAEQRARADAEQATQDVRDAERDQRALTAQAEVAARDAATATRRAETAADEAVTLAADTALTDPIAPPTLPGLTPPAPVNAAALRARLTAALDAAAAADDPTGGHAGATADELITDLVAFGAALKHTHAVVDTAAADARTALAQARAELRAARQAYDRDRRTLAAAEQRIAELRTGIDRDLAALPAPVAAALPDDDPATPVTGRIAAVRTALPAAQAALDQRRRHVEEHATAMRAAAAELTSVAQHRDRLRTREADAVTGPLRAVLTAADRAADLVAEGLTLLADEPAPSRPVTAPPTPISPASLTPDTVTTHLAAVMTALTDVTARLAAAADRTGERARGQLTDLRAQLAAALTKDEDASAADTPDGARLLDPAALDPLIVAASTAAQEARAARAEEAAARADIPRAAALDAALTAGRARVDALEDCRTLLAEGKFPAYVTTRRTRSLLGVASELFGQLSGGEFGFADDFSVVSRRTGVARSAKTLSGGETFLASLALALALVELYGRTGGRLGALFLDEGFGSLDVDTLGAALEVLRAEAGGDKLVAVISHLHAVAEAVDAVLFVEKGPAGSAARWLDDVETEALIRDDAAAGLLSLT